MGGFFSPAHKQAICRITRFANPTYATFATDMKKPPGFARGGSMLVRQHCCYHMMTRSFGGRYILSPGFTSKA
ncbi:hypothetical protein BW37_02882 [Janthinobacterium lividum]|nr:hypothetical protein BW37_02882 [Janthinobacterium lividum]